MSSRFGPILVVEDEPDARYVLSSALQDEGFDVDAAVDGAEALRLAAERQPTLVLLDWRLPGQDGGQLAAALRQRHPNVRFVLVTADGNAQRKADQIRAHGYLEKPYHLDDVMRAVSAALA
jgi:two-component system OmpR family response regulator